jgi:hypothetical protein
MARAEEDDEDIPWADPQIRLDYEAALGRFILAFNELDYYLSMLIANEYIERKVPRPRQRPLE